MVDVVIVLVSVCVVIGVVVLQTFWVSFKVLDLINVFDATENLRGGCSSDR